MAYSPRQHCLPRIPEVRTHDSRFCTYRIAQKHERSLHRTEKPFMGSGAVSDPDVLMRSGRLYPAGSLRIHKQHQSAHPRPGSVPYRVACLPETTKAEKSGLFSLCFSAVLQHALNYSSFPRSDARTASAMLSVSLSHCASCSTGFSLSSRICCGTGNRHRLCRMSEHAKASRCLTAVWP